MSKVECLFNHKELYALNPIDEDDVCKVDYELNQSDLWYKYEFGKWMFEKGDGKVESKDMRGQNGSDNKIGLDRVINTSDEFKYDKYKR